MSRWALYLKSVTAIIIKTSYLVVDVRAVAFNIGTGLYVLTDDRSEIDDAPLDPCAFLNDNAGKKHADGG